jgi:hypothetical protein
MAVDKAKVLAVLRETRRRMENPNTWTAQYYCVDVKGRPQPEWSADADRWCALGHLHAASGDLDTGYEVRQWLNDRGIHTGHLVFINDMEGREAACTWLDQAIAKVEEMA